MDLFNSGLYLVKDGRLSLLCMRTSLYFTMTLIDTIKNINISVQNVLFLLYNMSCTIFKTSRKERTSLEKTGQSSDIRLRCMSDATGGPINPLSQSFLSRFPNNPYIPNAQKASKTLVTPLVFPVFMGGGACLPSG